MGASTLCAVNGIGLRLMSVQFHATRECPVAKQLIWISWLREIRESHSHEEGRTSVLEIPGGGKS